MQPGGARFVQTTSTPKRDPGRSRRLHQSERPELPRSSPWHVIHGVDVAWLTFAHDTRGAPSKEFLPLLMALGRMLAPSLVHARERMRGALFETLVEEAPDGMLALDAVGTAIEVNRAALRLLGLTRGQVVGHSIGELLGPTAKDAGNRRRGTSLPKTVNLEAGDKRPELDVVVARVEGISDASFRVHLRDATCAGVRPKRRRRPAAWSTSRSCAGSPSAWRGTSTSRPRSSEPRRFKCAGRPRVGGVMMFRAEGGGTTRGGGRPSSRRREGGERADSACSASPA